MRGEAAFTTEHRLAMQDRRSGSVRLLRVAAQGRRQLLYRHRYQEPSIEMVEVDSGDVLAMRDSRFGELLDEINAKQKQIAYATIFGVGVGAVGLGILYAVGSSVLDLGSQVDLGRQVGVAVLLLALPAWAIGRWVDSYKRRSVLFYDLDQDATKAYEAVTRAFDEMMACAGKWHREAQGAVHDLATWKRNAGAGIL